jgi:hypothetical protein
VSIPPHVDSLSFHSAESSLASTPRRFPFWLPPLFYLLLSCLFLWRSVFAGDVFLPAGLLGHVAPWKNHLGLDTLPPWNPLRWDGIAQFYPWRHFAAQSVRAGTIPLWNPYQFCGTPFVANSQSAVFYPGNLLFYLMPDTACAFGYSAVLHLTLCGWFTYLLLRRLRCSLVAALTGGVVFAFSSWQVGWLQLPTFLATSCWIPLLLHQVYGLRQTLSPRSHAPGAPVADITGETSGSVAVQQGPPVPDRSPLLALRSMAGIAAVVGMMLLAGHLQIAFYGLMAATLWMIGVLWRVGVERGGAEALGGLAMAVGGFAVGLAMASPQILPALELSRVSHRVAKPSAAGYAAYTEYALPSSQLAALTLPDLFGGDSSSDNPYWGFYLKALPSGPSVAVRHNAAETAVYVGIGTLALGLLALSRGLRRSRPDRRVLFFAGLAAVALLLALGTPVNALFYFLIPGFGQSGSPARCLVLWALAWAALSAFGMDALRERRPSRREVGIVLSGLTVVFALGLLLTLLTLLLKPDGAKWIPSFAEATGRIGPGWARLALCVAGISALLLWKSSRVEGTAAATGPRERLALVGMLLLTTDLLSTGILANPTAPPSAVYPVTSAIRYLQENLGHERIFPVNQRWGLFSAPPTVLPPNAGLVYGLRDVQGYDSLFTGQYKSFANGFARRNSMGTLDASPPEVGNIVFFQNARAANAGVLGAAIVVSLPPDGSGTSAESLPQTALLPASDDTMSLYPMPPHPARAHLRTEDGPDTVIWNEDRANHLGLTVNARRAGMLDIDDQFYPGWQANIDGAPVFIRRQEVAPIFRSVEVPAGRHTVTFTYRPAAIRLGLFLTCIAAGFLAFAATGTIANRLYR